jgi:hypothetical protein
VQHCCGVFEMEREQFLRRLRESRGQAAGADGAAGGSPHVPLAVRARE